MILIKNLLVTQNAIDSKTDEFKNMVEFVKAGGFFTEDAIKNFMENHASNRSLEPAKRLQLISINFFQTDVAGIHDGHHRVSAIYVGGRNYLRADEYFCKNMPYKMYNEINPKVGYVTPFNPITEVRLLDFREFKTEALKLLNEDPDSGYKYILEHKHMYATNRTTKTVMDLLK